MCTRAAPPHASGHPHAQSPRSSFSAPAPAPVPPPSPPNHHPPPPPLPTRARIQAGAATQADAKAPFKFFWAERALQQVLAAKAVEAEPKGDVPKSLYWKAAPTAESKAKEEAEAAAKAKAEAEVEAAAKAREAAAMGGLRLAVPPSSAWALEGCPKEAAEPLSDAFWAEHAPSVCPSVSVLPDKQIRWPAVDLSTLFREMDRQMYYDEDDDWQKHEWTTMMETRCVMNDDARAKLKAQGKLVFDLSAKPPEKVWRRNARKQAFANTEGFDSDELADNDDDLY